MEGNYTDYMVYGNFCSMDNQAFPIDCETLSALQGNTTKLAVIAHIAGCERLILTGCKLQSNGIRTEGYVFVVNPDNPLTGEVLYHPEARDRNGKCQIYEYDEDVTADGTEYPGAYSVRYLDDDVYWSGDGVMEWSSFTDIADISNATLKALLDNVNKDIADLKKIFNGGLEGNATNFATLLSNEAKAREAADKAEADARSKADTALDKKIADETTAREKAVSDEEAARKKADEILGRDIKAEIQNREKAISNLSKQIEAINGAPSGIITLWHGLSSDVPYGWALCDGKEHEFNGKTIRTPNLMGVFALGAMSDDDGGDTIPVGSTGGKNLNEISITLTPDNLPEHRHIYTDDTHLWDQSHKCEYIMEPPSNRQDWDSWSANGSGSGQTVLSGSEIFTKTGELASSTKPKAITRTLNNMPPYLALYYIMKL
ncbi:MAG: hypothetical protein IKP73_12165 [Bacteroidales bacterium]|nr:hypothetical protein [Bacteroidales bacterium]